MNTLTAKGIDLNIESVEDEDAEYQPDANSECENCKM